MLQSFCLIFLTFQITVQVVDSAANLKGVHPELLNTYQSATGQFTCLDGSRTINADQVNDDYCDCPDGSDEPGTSACPNSWFYCRNKGHEPKLLASQFVKDGICDCCDGTDEAKGVCENTCHLAIAAEKSKLEHAIGDYKQALETKEQYILKAKTKREEFTARSATIDDEIEQQASIVKQLEEQKDALEAEHRRTEDDARAEHEARVAAEKEKAEAAAAQQAAEADQAASETEESAETEEAAAEVDGNAVETEQGSDATEQDTATEGHPEGDQDESTLSAEELGRKIASQWTNDPEAAGHAGTEGDQPLEDEEPAQDLGLEAWEQEGHEGQEHQYDEPDLHHDHQDSYASSHFQERLRELWEDTVTSVSGWWRSLVSRLPVLSRATRKRKHGLAESEELKEARRKYYEEKEKLEDLEKSKNDAAEVKDLDLGAYDEFLELSGKCFTSHETQFTYEACFFREASQREGHGAKTNIGKWKAFEAGHTEALFDDGDWCWQAPNRSLRLQLECGQTEKMYGLEEPGRCVYRGKFQTPAACREDGLKELEAKLARLHEIELEIKNENVHDEL